MPQRPYLPKDTELDIGAVHLTPAITDISLIPAQEYYAVRPLGDAHNVYAVGKLGRSIGLVGVYDGDEADAFKAMQDGQEYAARLIVDKGENSRIHAGMVLATDYELTAPGSDVLKVTGAAPISGTVYIGSGNAGLSDSLVVSVEHTAVCCVVRTAGVEIAGQTGTLTFTATQGANTYTAVVEVRETTGCYIEALTGTLPTTGDVSIAVAASGFTTDPVIEWGAIRPEGTFD